MVVSEYIKDLIRNVGCTTTLLEDDSIDEILNMIYDVENIREIDGEHYIEHTSFDDRLVPSLLSISEMKEICKSKIKELEHYHLTTLHNNLPIMQDIFKKFFEPENENAVMDDDYVYEQWKTLIVNLNVYIVNKIIINAAISFTTMLSEPDGVSENFIQKNTELEFYEILIKIIQDFSCETVFDYLPWLSIFSACKPLEFLNNFENDEEMKESINLINHEILKRIMFTLATISGANSSAFECLNSYKRLISTYELKHCREKKVETIILPISKDDSLIYCLEGYKKAFIGFCNTKKFEGVKFNDAPLAMDVKKVCSYVSYPEFISVETFLFIVYLYFGFVIPSLVAKGLTELLDNGKSKEEVIDFLENQSESEFDLTHNSVPREKLIEYLDKVVQKSNGKDFF